jgi:PAS domain S-box-containing protein
MQENDRIRKITELIAKYVSADFGAGEIVLDNDNEPDAVIAGLNIIEEQLKTRRIAEKTQTQKIAEYEKYSVNLIQMSSDAIITVDEQGIITNWNQQAETMFGWKEAEARGKALSQTIIPEQFREAHRRRLSNFLTNGEEALLNKPIELFGLRRDNTEFPMKLKISASKITDRYVFIFFIRNITEQKKTEEKLKEYQYFFNNSHDLIAITNETHFEIINPNFQRVLGYSEKELLDEPFLNFIHPDDIDATIYELKKLNAGAETNNFTNRYRKKNGDYLLFEWNVSPDPITGKLYASARDITDRNKAEEELKNSEHFLNSILENIPAMIFVKDAKDLRFVRFNKAGEELLGYSKADLIGKNDYNFFPKTEADFFTSKDRAVLESGKLLAIDEEPIHTKYKGDRILETKKIPILDSNGHPLYLLGISNDITDLKKLLTEREQKSKELANTNKELEQFVYVASHDLQEPLRTISNFVGVLEKKYSGITDKETIQYLQFIVDAAARMRNLIKDLLDLSRIGRNATFTIVDCNEVFREVIANLEASIKESNAKVTSATLPILKGNTGELKQLFQNLISNAIKFRKKDAIPEINITVEDKDAEYLFAIKDNGIGIEEQSINKLFVIFQRLNTASEYPGTGIGLATCKKIVALHNGRIWVESKFGAGSTFYFTLPKEKLT